MFYCRTPCIVASTHRCTYMYYFITQLAFLSVHTVSNAGRQAGWRSPLFQFYLSRCPRVLVQYVSLNMRFIVTLCEEGAGYIALRLTDTCHIQHTRGSLHVEINEHTEK